MNKEGWSVIYKEKRFDLKQDQLVVIPPNTQFSTEGSVSATQFYIHFTIRSLGSQYKSGVYFLPVTNDITTFINKLKIACLTPEEVFIQTLRIKHFCLETLVRLPSNCLEVEKYSFGIVKSMELMLKTPCRLYSNEELAKEVGMSTSSFIQLFRAETGTPPQKWHLKKRIDSAALLLSHSGKTIDEISEETAFFDRNHFSHMFKKIIGMSPAAYRKQLERTGS